MVRLLVPALCAVLGAALVVPALAPAELPVQYKAPRGVAIGPSTSPSGANDWACRPSAQRPRPVILIPATAEYMGYNWATLSPVLKNAGYCVFSLNYGAYRTPTGRFYFGGKPIASSASELAGFVARVREASGAAQVDLVGHSQGGILAEYYVKFLGGADAVRNIVGIASPTRGSDLSGLLGVGTSIRRGVPVLGPALWALLRAEVPSMLQLSIGSSFLKAFNGVPEPAGVSYTKIASKWDPVATPYRNVWIDGGNNVLLQRGCEIDLSDHMAPAFTRRGVRVVLNALDPAVAKRPPCGFVRPLGSGG